MQPPVHNSRAIDLITIRLASEHADRDGSDLKQHLEDCFGIDILEEFVESADWKSVALFVAPAAVPLAKYAGKKLIDALSDSLRAWLHRNRHVEDIVLYGPDGKIINKVSRK